MNGVKAPPGASQPDAGNDASEPERFRIAPVDVLYGRAMAVTDSYSAYAALIEIVRAYGFRNFSLLVFPAEATSSYQKTIYITNNSSEFIGKYDTENHLPNNLTISRLRQSTVPITWDIRSFRADARRVERHRTVELLAEFGMFMGTNFALNDSRGNHGGLILTGDRPIPDVTELAALNLLGNVIFDRLNIRPEARESALSFQLSERERQVLAWASAGKTSWEIATILELSEHTVNQYFSTCTQKLQATNRLHAVAQALRLKLID
jgi:LuxR family transcriptional regulator, quorum-sensing system regulator BjaR1